MNLETLVTRQEITEKVLAASLEIDSVNAVIDSEIEQIRGIRADLQVQRDKAQNIINIASIVTGGVAGAITSAMQFKPSTVNSLLRIRRTLLKDAVAARDSHSSVALARSGRHDEDQAHTHGAAHDGAREDPGRASARALVHLGDRDRLSRA